MDISFKEECIALRKEGRSIIEIMRITGRPKTSIYLHIRDIPLSSDRWKSIRTASGEHIRKFALARKGKSVRQFVTFEAWTPDLALLVAHLTFDGGLRHGVCEYNNRSEVLVERVEYLMRSLYVFEPKRNLNGFTGVIRTSYFNVALSDYLKEKSQELRSTIKNLSLDTKREFLRAFFDDEGCMDYRPIRKIRNVRGYQKDVSILCLVQSLLTDFNITSSIKKPNEVVVSGKENLLNFQKEINFSPGVRINGNRSNSIWKESLEKRDLLQRAIDSFKL